MGYAPGLALQVSGVSDFFGSVFNCVLLLLSCLRLLDSACGSWTGSATSS